MVFVCHHDEPRKLIVSKQNMRIMEVNIVRTTYMAKASEIERKCFLIILTLELFTFLSDSDQLLFFIMYTTRRL